MKSCSSCKELKDTKDFYKNKKSSDGLTIWCKLCERKYKRNNYDPERDRANRIKYSYGVSVKEIENMAISQHYKCAICKKQCPKLLYKGQLFIDHDHNTGKVRGLLCNDCNLFLGRAFDNINILQNAIDYLKKNI